MKRSDSKLAHECICQKSVTGLLIQQFHITKLVYEQFLDPYPSPGRGAAPAAPPPAASSSACLRASSRRSSISASV
uniref:Uncharacterized protein n=1 Tax=Triticum urartu TaxID=4572 RepID=A0A8R7UA73_TRIUA